MRATKGGKTFAQFNVAVPRGYKDAAGKTPVDFIPVKVWNGAAKFVSEYCGKGTAVAVTDELHSSPYTDKDGNARTWTEIAASTVSRIAGSSKPLQNAEDTMETAEEAALPF